MVADHTASFILNYNIYYHTDLLLHFYSVIVEFEVTDVNVVPTYLIHHNIHNNILPFVRGSVSETSPVLLP